jgi:hypothetical protein
MTLMFVPKALPGLKCMRFYTNHCFIILYRVAKWRQLRFGKHVTMSEKDRVISITQKVKKVRPTESRPAAQLGSAPACMGGRVPPGSQSALRHTDEGSPIVNSERRGR